MLIDTKGRKTFFMKRMKRKMLLFLLLQWIFQVSKDIYMF